MRWRIRGSGDSADLERDVHRCIDAVTKGIEGFSFNKSVAALYTLTNALAKSEAPKSARRAAMLDLVVLMNPFTPHLAEEIWQKLGGKGLIVRADWPVLNPNLLQETNVIIPIQVNGKRRAEISVSAEADKTEVEALALAQDGVIRAIDGKPIKKLIVVPGRVVNVVV